VSAHRARPAEPGSAVSDGATTEVVRSYLVAAAEEMRATLIRTAFNPVIYEVLDFGISIYDAEMRAIAEAPGLTMFLGANDYSLRMGVEYVGLGELHRGDVVMLNYPYWNAAHAYDATMFAPVFEPPADADGGSGDDGVLLGFVCVRAHWMDLGAKDPGYVLDSTDVHQEGILFPGTKVFERGVLNHQVVELIRFNSRMPELVIGDMHAQVAALRTGERRLVEVVGKFGRAVVDAAVEEFLGHAERATREALLALPQGSWSAVDWLDDDGISAEPVRMEVTVTIRDGSFIVDFAGSSPATTGPVNMPFGSTIASARVAFKSITSPFAQNNHGFMAPLEVRAEPGTLFHAVYPAPTFTQWTGNQAVELIFKAVAQGLGDTMPACSGGDVPGFMMVGIHPDTGELFAISNNDVVGWGATATHDGAGPLNHPCQTVARNTPMEVMEARTGMRFERLEISADSGGAGRFRGGCGVRRDIVFVSDGEFLSVIKKTKSAPWALAGGLSPVPNRVIAFAGTDRERAISTERLVVKAGDRVRLLTAGGGGHGDPAERDPAAIRRDLDQGYITAGAAREHYGYET
jgi:N-methylhydantoinase B